MSKVTKVLAFAILVLLIYAPRGVFAQNSSLYSPVVLLDTDSFHFNFTSYNYVTRLKRPKKGDDFLSITGGINYKFSFYPDFNSEGPDTVLIQHFPVQSNVYTNTGISFLIKQVIANNDVYQVSIDNPSYQLQVLSNDRTSSPALHIDQFVLIDNANASISSDQQTLIFSPVASGMAYIGYTVCDDEGHCDYAVVSIQVVPNQIPSGQDTLDLFTLKNQDLTFFEPFDSTVITLAPYSGQLTLTNELQLTYSPNSGFVGTDEVILGSYSNPSNSRLLRIHVLAHTTSNKFAMDDLYYTPKNNTVQFNVLVNDLSYGIPIQSFSQPINGSVQYQGSGVFLYTPQLDFIGWDEYTYTIGSNVTEPETATVSIFVSNLLPSAASLKYTTPKNSVVVVNQNIPFSPELYTITLNTPAGHGDVELLPGFQTVLIGSDTIKGTNLTLYTPDDEFVGEDEFRLNYCIGNDCHIIKVLVSVIDTSAAVCYQYCVWPGDGDNNGRVDMRDLLSLGYYLGESGAERPNPSLDQWYGQSSPNWPTDQAGNGQNMKFLDADGDGLIAALDTAGIKNFYLKEHSILTQHNELSGQVPMFLIPQQTSVNAGDTLRVDIYVGEEANPAINFGGLSFHFNWQEGTINGPSAYIEWNKSSWLAQGSASLPLYVKPNLQRFDAGITRVNNKTASGYGKIGTFVCIVDEDLEGFKGEKPENIQIDIEDIYASGNAGILTHMPNGQVLIPLAAQAAIEKSDSPLVVYPNPSSGDFQIFQRTSAEIYYYTLYDATGRTLYQSNAPVAGQQTTIPGKGLEDGIYFLRAATPAGPISVKLQVIH
ncbi:MAG: T9SS type A sorting domain-containing protein [Saprospiraceae bacterium]